MSTRAQWSAMRPGTRTAPVDVGGVRRYTLAEVRYVIRPGPP